MKVCIVTKYGKATELCTDHRHFISTVKAMEGTAIRYAFDKEKLEEKLREILLEANKFCEMLNCPYLRDMA